MTNNNYISFEEMVEIFMSDGPEWLDEDTKEVKRKIQGRSLEEIFSIGKEYANDEDYLEAMVVFDEVAKQNKTKRELAQLYSPIVFSIIYSRAGDNQIAEDIIANKMIYCMMESTRMYTEKKIPKEELMDLERMIDRVNFKGMRLQEREEFERIYYKFKEYCIDVFIKENEQRNNK